MDRLAIDQPGPALEIRFYEIDAAKSDAFLDFFRGQVKPWLIDHGVKRADAWLVERDGGVQFVLVSPGSPPWDTLTGTDQFLKGSHPLRIQPLPDLAISSP